VNRKIRWGGVIFKKVFLAGIVSLLAGSILVACGQPAEVLLTPDTAQPPADIENQAPKEASPPEEITNEAEWNTVQIFTGKESETTPPFHIFGAEWRLTWMADIQYPEYAVFDIFVYPQDERIFTKRVSYSEDASDGIAYMYDGDGDYYLKVITANLDSWTITVEEHAKPKLTSPVQITKINYKGMDYADYYKGIGFPQPGEGSPRIVESDEYVEIKNLSDSPQDISGWLLKNVTKGAPTFIFPTFLPCFCQRYGDSEECLKKCYPIKPCMIEPHESIRVYTGEAHYESGGFSFYYFTGNIWNNEIPDTAVLYDSEGQEVSRKSYVVPAESSPIR
jgi:hypothetical protein